MEYNSTCRIYRRMPATLPLEIAKISSTKSAKFLYQTVKVKKYTECQCHFCILKKEFQRLEKTKDRLSNYVEYSLPLTVFHSFPYLTHFMDAPLAHDKAGIQYDKIMLILFLFQI